MIKVILSGCGGKMGGTVCEVSKSYDDVEIVCGVDIRKSAVCPFPVVGSISHFKGNADVIIDFSNPDNVESLLDYALGRSMPVVIATTGLSSGQLEYINRCSEKIPIFYSSNMSLGINVMLNLVAKASKVFDQSSDVEIIEKHHNQKLDAPSGTALLIADEIAKASEQPCKYVYDRHSVRKKRCRNEIGILSVRAGSIVGEHTAIFASGNEIIEITHKALSRELFAQGAITAAKFTASKTAGLYNMKDLVSDN